ncbi:MAG: FecR domain-containing protein [Chloracidobacterium sp.]|nr:FecR domain-containing protein [Chloracidobacterium sp.]
MRSLARMFWLAVFAVTSVGFVLGASASQTLNLPEGGLNAVVEDDTDPEVTDRVARISFIRGDVKIRRVGSEDWEKAVLNLPLIEGDQIATGDDARVEIQLNSYSHIRLGRNAFLKFSTLKYDGIAVSLSQGTMAVRVTDLEKAGGFFEIDAPNTTVAIQKAGSYRIDAGQSGDQDLRVSVASGEARVYSDNAGFTLKSGRGARVFIGGANAGEWETLDVARFSDEFDTWSQDRDSTIAKRLSNAYYDQYYDQDIYGADDLNGYGDWVHTSNYGYVWQPYNTSISNYADWSPYRYGHWRWLGAYGWTWVNDEPWGWATYHHGRWIYHNGRWVWAPYGYYRQRRSWWSPAMVVINIISTNVYWYPLPYNCHFYGWHRGPSGGGWGGNGNGNGNGNGGVRNPKGIDPTRKPPIRVPGGGGSTTGQIDPNAKGGGRLNPGDTPPIGVITVSEDDFGRTAKGGRRAPDLIAKEILTKDPADISNVRLPDPTERKRPLDREIIAAKPRFEPTTKIGAAERQNDKPLDQELRQKRIYGDRSPVVISERKPLQVQNGEPTDKRPTGAVERQKPVKRDDTPTPIIRQEPTYTPQEKPRERQPRPEVVPEYKPPVRQSPRQDPPVYSSPIRQEPRKDPPTRQPPTRTDPPTKSEPKPTDKPSRQPDSDRKKDNP